MKLCLSTGMLSAPALLASAAWAAAQERASQPLVTDRPDFTESAAAVAPGMFQLEAGYTFTRDGEIKRHSLGEVLLRIGLLPRAELRIGLNSYGWTASPADDAHGFEDASLGVKLRLLDGAEGFAPTHPSVALLLATTLPIGADGFGEEEPQPEGRLALAWELSERLALGSNLNFAYASQEGDRFGQLSGSVALGLSLTEALGGYLEYFGFAPASPDGPNTSFVNGGLTLLIDENFQLDGRAGAGLNGKGPDYFAGFGLAWRR